MHLFLDMMIKGLLSRLFCVQIILKCNCNTFITGEIFSYCAEVKGVKSETFLGMGCVVNGIACLKEAEMDISCIHRH